MLVALSFIHFDCLWTHDTLKTEFLGVGRQVASRPVDVDAVGIRQGGRVGSDASGETTGIIWFIENFNRIVVAVVVFAIVAHGRNWRWSDTKIDGDLVS